MTSVRIAPGERIGRLVVQYARFVPEKGLHMETTWRCRCDCGNEVDIGNRKLYQMGYKGGGSCGCWRRENARRAGKARLIDETGKRYGRLTVLGRADVRGSALSDDAKECAYWTCRCDCGNILTVCGRDLRNGGTKSCGCFHSELISQRGTKGDMVGKRFGRLVVIRRTDDPPGTWNGVRYVCRCDCGMETVVRGRHLRQGLVKSCGCLRRELLIERNIARARQ